MTKIRIGDGRTPSGKILDRDTTWFNVSEKEHAIQQAVKTKKRIYISVKNSAYKEITLDELKNIEKTISKYENRYGI